MLKYGSYYLNKITGEEYRLYFSVRHYGDNVECVLYQDSKGSVFVATVPEFLENFQENPHHPGSPLTGVPND